MAMKLTGEIIGGFAMGDEIGRPLIYDGTNVAFVGNYMDENGAPFAESIVAVLYLANII